MDAKERILGEVVYFRTHPDPSGEERAQDRSEGGEQPLARSRVSGLCAVDGLRIERVHLFAEVKPRVTAPRSRMRIVGQRPRARAATPTASAIFR